MKTTTFTEKLVDLLINGGMPSAKGKDATESGLVFAQSDNKTPVCAAYGSAEVMARLIANALERDRAIRCVLYAAVAADALEHPEDPDVVEMIEYWKRMTH